MPDNSTITYNGYTWNRPAGILLPGVTQKTYAYDNLMRMKTITVKDPAQQVKMNYSYGFDNMDNIVSRETEHGAYAYEYDNLYRLTHTDDPLPDNETFTYDPVGNRLTYHASDPWQYSTNNELLTANNATYAYDENGNTIAKSEGASVTNYIYDIDNRLVRVEDGSNNIIAQYSYDPFGRRLSKTVGVTTTYFFYADEGLIGEYAADGTQIKAYGYKPGSTWTTAQPVKLPTARATGFLSPLISVFIPGV